MKSPRTSEILVANDEYFVANLENGAIRFGMLAGIMFDFPPDHEQYDRVKSLDLANAEELFDEYFLRYFPAATNVYR